MKLKKYIATISILFMLSGCGYRVESNCVDNAFSIGLQIYQVIDNKSALIINKGAFGYPNGIIYISSKQDYFKDRFDGEYVVVILVPDGTHKYETVGNVLKTVRAFKIINNCSIKRVNTFLWMKI